MADEELRLRLTATDDASKVIDGVATDAERLEKSDPTVTVNADDNASPELREVLDRVEDLDGRTAEAILKAEVKKFKADERAARRALADFDGSQSEAELLLDVERAEENLAGLQDKLDEVTDGAGDAGEKAGGGFSKGFGAAAIAASIVATINAGFERIRARAIMSEQFGLIKSDAKRIGKEAADIYADGWGDSAAEVRSALGLVEQQLVRTKTVSQAESDEIAKSALVISEVFGSDVNEVIRATGQILKNGLAPDAESAMDAVYEAMQNGADGAGDLFDSIDEYSQHFGKFGLNAEDMFSIFETGLANGERDTDKLADAVKELAIRATDFSDTTQKAYDDLGLSADDYRAKILAGGTSARTAYSEILSAIESVRDPAKQQQIAIDLIGTQYEDLGPTALESLQAIGDGLVETTGAVRDGTAAVENATSEYEKMKRRGSEAFGAVAEEAAGLANKMIDGFTGAETQFDRTVEALAALTDSSITDIPEALELVKEYGIDAETAAEMVDGWAEKQRLLGVELTQGESRVLGWARAAEQAAEDAERAGWEARYAASGIKDAGDKADDTTTEIDDLKDSFADLRNEMSDRSAFLSMGDEFDTLAKRGEDAWNAAAEGSEDAEAKARDYEQAQIDLKGSVIDYAEEVGNIPEDQVTDILALIDEGAIAEAERRLASLERVRITRVSVQTAGTSTYVPSGSGSGGYSHVGSRFAAGETKQVVPGQVFTPDVPGRMASVEESRRMLSSQSTGGTMQPLIINLAGERQVKGWIDQRDAQALAEFEAGAR